MFVATVKVNKGKPLVPRTKQDNQAVGELIKSEILESCARGVDAAGQSFKPYSSEYAEENGEKVDLRKTGTLLNSLTVSATDTTATVSTDVSYAAKVDAQRPFMGIDEKDADRVMQLVVKQYDKHAEDANKSNGGGAVISPRKD